MVPERAVAVAAGDLQSLINHERPLTERLIRKLGIRDAENARANVACALFLALPNLDPEQNIEAYLYGAILQALTVTRRIEIKGLIPLKDVTHYADPISMTDRDDLAADPTLAIETAIDVGTSLRKLHDRVIIRVQLAEQRQARADELAEQANICKLHEHGLAESLIREANTLQEESAAFAAEAKMMFEGLEALRAYFLMDQSYGAVAETLGIGKKLVEKRIKWALEELRWMNEI